MDMGWFFLVGKGYRSATFDIPDRNLNYTKQVQKYHHIRPEQAFSRTITWNQSCRYPLSKFRKSCRHAVSCSGKWPVTLYVNWKLKTVWWNRNHSCQFYIWHSFYVILHPKFHDSGFGCHDCSLCSFRAKSSSRRVMKPFLAGFLDVNAKPWSYSDISLRTCWHGSQR